MHGRHSCGIVFVHITRFQTRLQLLRDAAALAASPSLTFSLVSAEKLSRAKEENVGMHQVLDQTLQELNSL